MLKIHEHHVELWISLVWHPAHALYWGSTVCMHSLKPTFWVFQRMHCDLVQKILLSLFLAGWTCVGGGLLALGGNQQRWHQRPAPTRTNRWWTACARTARKQRSHAYIIIIMNLGQHIAKSTITQQNYTFVVLPSISNQPQSTVNYILKYDEASNSLASCCVANGTVTSSHFHSLSIDLSPLAHGTQFLGYSVPLLPVLYCVLLASCYFN